MVQYREPIEEQVKEVLRRIPTLQLRRAFFEGLRNPHWVKPLSKQKAFDSPPEPKVLEDGAIRDIYWPEIDYLVRMSAEVPADVVDVLLKLTKSGNAWVRQAVFEIGSSIPADQAARLRPLISSWAPTGLGWRTDPRHLAGFAVNLLNGGQRKDGVWFANLLFKPLKMNRPDKASVPLDEYWYAHELPQVAEALGVDGLGVVLQWLVTFERQSGRLTKSSDVTYFARDSVRVGKHSHEDVEQALVDAVRDLAIDAMGQDAEQAKAVLFKVEMILARKIALFALSEAIERSGDDEAAILLDAADGLLFDKQSFSESCRIDYADLARSVASRRPDSLEPLAGFINEACVRLDDDRLREWFAREDDDPAAIGQKVEEYQQAWMHRWLAAIGGDVLPEQLRGRLAELDARLGAIESPREPSRAVFSWSGPNSPVAQAEMSMMSPNELVAHLESWHDASDGFGPEPSHEGQGRSLAAHLTTNPAALVGLGGLVGRLRPTYLRSIAQGWEAAVKANLKLDWDQSLDFVEELLAHRDESEFPIEGRPFDDDPDLRPAKTAAVGLLEELAKKRAADDVVPEEAMSRIAQLLIEKAGDVKEFPEYLIGAQGSDMDALTLSLNWRWPVRLRGLTHLISYGAETSWFTAACSVLVQELARDDLFGASRAVLGEGLTRLVLADEGWVESRLQDWFGGESGTSRNQQLALSVAVATHRYHKRLYDILSASMIGSIGADGPIAAGWRTQTDPVQQIGGWVVEAIIRGDATLDDGAAETFFTVAPAKIRGGAMGHVAWLFMRADDVASAMRDRFAELWDDRLGHVRSHPEDRDELGGFCWVVKSGKFDVAWWLPRLQEAATLNPGLGRERYMIGNELAVAASEDPRAAFDVLRLLLEGQNGGLGSYDLLKTATPMVLARAMASGDETLRNDAELYMNRLGELGNLSLESEVQASLADL